VTLLVATTNPGKIREIRHVLEGAVDGLRLLTLAEVPPVAEPEETGLTFADNAWLKARHYARATGRPTVAEDSGLEIDALEGRPGVHSARYPGETYPLKFLNLYRELAPHPRPWTARYVCSVAVANPPVGDDAEPLFACEATVEGEIADEPLGNAGFGYDPIFYYPSYMTTLGNVPDERKLAVAHRGKAFRQLAAWLAGRPGALAPRINDARP
jgi:XTP/dITP diphosphohydrolase